MFFLGLVSLCGFAGPEFDFEAAKYVKAFDKTMESQTENSKDKRTRNSNTKSYKYKYGFKFGFPKSLTKTLKYVLNLPHCVLSKDVLSENLVYIHL